jgi:hypothetical protein
VKQNAVDTPVAADDGRLRELLDLEKRLQDAVRAAQEQRSREIDGANAVREQRLAAAHEAAARADAEQARVEQLEQERALSALQAAHQRRLDSIASLSEERVDELARWVLQRAIGGNAS